MTLLVHYPTKQKLKDSHGAPLRYTETSMFGPEYKSDGWLTVAGRPTHSVIVKREFFARVLMAGGKIMRVE